MRLITLLTVGTLLLCCGCGRGKLETLPASGRVIFEDGQPVQLGTIEFESVEHGVVARGKIGADGKFVLGTYSEKDGAVAGRHRAVVTQLFVTDPIGASGHKHDHGGIVDLSYASFDTSPLSYTIKEDEQNSFEVRVTRKTLRTK